MASIDLLEELQLNDYHPHKLSFSEAIKLDSESKNGCPKQHGLDIVRKLLTLDSSAVDSVIIEINRLGNTGKTETNIRPPQKSNVRPAWKSGNIEQSERKLHPMDVLVVVMNCCDDLLRQILAEKMFTNKLSIPILLPDLENGSFTLQLFALRSLVPEVRDRRQDSSASLTDTLVDMKNPVVSFIRVGKLHRSKSMLVNELLNLKSFDTFFHRKCLNGSAKRSVSNGSIEAAWFQSETANEDEFGCKFFTALNLRGDARDYPKQTQFLCQSSTLVVFMVESFESFKELYENFLKNSEASHTKFLVSYISSESPDKVLDTYFDFLDDLSDRGTIFRVIYDWHDATKEMSDVDFVKEMRNMISAFSVQEHWCADQLSTYADISRSGKNFGFQLDENKQDYESGKASADAFLNLLSRQPKECKPLILPLQGEPWEKIGKLERVQRGKSQDSNHDEYFIAKKETEIRRQREIQCYSFIQQNEVIANFSSTFHSLQDQSLSCYLSYCKIKLDARNRAITSSLTEEYTKKKQKKLSHTCISNDPEVQSCQIDLKIEHSTIGMEHILREHGQMYEAVISEEIHMRVVLKNARLTPDVIRNFPSIVARLLLNGEPLELMDGDASNVPITWLTAVLNQITIMTNNAKVFVLSIIGVQSSGKSTLLNALFGLQFPVSAGRCTRGIYCQLVPVDKESLIVKYNYVLVVDTEGLRAPQFTGNSNFKDNELATFAIGLADAAIVNMKGENWTEMKDILQIVACGLIRVRKTKPDLNLMPRCIFVYQNVPAADAEEKNWLGQEKQLTHLDNAVKVAARDEGFTHINKFDDVVNFDPHSHSRYFPDLLNDKPPRARISQGYTRQANELRKLIMQLMKDNQSNLTISGFFHRMSDLWNAMLHSDILLYFRNTQEMMLGTALNDRISHGMDDLKNLNKLEQTKTRGLIYSLTSIEECNAQQERIVRDLIDAVQNNCTDMVANVNETIDGYDFHSALKKKYSSSLNALRDGELRRITEETAIDFRIHVKTIENENSQKIRELKGKLVELEKSVEEVATDKLLSETSQMEFEERWKKLLVDGKMLVHERMKSVESEIKYTILGSVTKFRSKDIKQFHDWTEISKPLSVVKLPEVVENDIVENKKWHLLPKWVMDNVHFESHVYKARRGFQVAFNKWELQFKNQKGKEFNASDVDQVMLEVGKLLGISKEQHFEVPTVTDEICSNLPPGYVFSDDYIVKFIKFVCHYIHNRTIENSKTFITLTDPLADIEDRLERSISKFRQMTAEAIIDSVSHQIFDYAKKSFVTDLGELIKGEVRKKECKRPTFKDKRKFLKAVLRHLADRTKSIANVNEEQKTVFKDFMLYVELGESEDSQNFFLDVILEFLKEILTKENTDKSGFQKMVENHLGESVKTAKTAITKLKNDCEGSEKEYNRILGAHMNVTSDYVEAVLEKVDYLCYGFLSDANSSFEKLVCEDNRAAIRPLFEKIMGCRERCPFCSAPCSQSLHQHADDHRANHYPTGVSGTVDIWGLFANTQETLDAKEERREERNKLSVITCQTLVGSGVDFRTKATVNKYNEHFYKLFNLNYHSFKNYKEIADYENWDIPPSRDHKASLFWKCFMAQYDKELAEHFKRLCPDIPEAWKTITWEEAVKTLDDPDLIT